MKDKASQHEHTSPTNYFIGFVLSIVLTLLAYFAVTNHWFGTGATAAFIVALALVQFAVQLLFFLHLAQEDGPRWRLGTLVFMAIIVIILVAGSIWIMNNLNYNMLHLSPAQQNTYLQQNEGL